MLSLCGCTSRRRAKQPAILSDENVAPKAKASLGPSQTMAHDTVPSLGDGRLSLDDFGVQPSEIPKRKASNALEAVKAKLIRHLSYDKDHSQKPQASPDSDKEEIARRAELRRFRARRIQEELNQDRSKSISAHTSIRSTRYLSPFIDIGRPGHGPRDAIEFSIDSGSHLPAPYPSPIPSLTSLKSKPPNMQMKRWSSCPAAIGEQPGQVATPFYNKSNATISWKRYTTPGKITGSKSLPNLLQLSIRAPQMARTKTATFGSESPTTMDAWLTLQESRSRASPALSVTDHRMPSLGSRRCHFPPANRRTTDFSQDTVTNPYPVRQSGASQRLPSVSMRQRGSQAAGNLKQGSTNCPQQRSLAVSTDGKKNTSSSSSQRRTRPSETPGGISSSYYPSVMPSIQPSPSRSNSLVNVLSMRDLQSLELSPFDWHDDNSILKSFGTSGDDGSSYATAEDGENDSQTSPRIYNSSDKRGHDGQVDEQQAPHRRFKNTLSIRKHRKNSKSDITVNDSRYPKAGKNTRSRTERSGLPTVWRSGSGSWDIQASLPKRISSKLWYQSRRASETIPEANCPVAVCEDGSTHDKVGISVGPTAGAENVQGDAPATLRKSKLETSNGFKSDRKHDTSKVPGIPHQSAQPSVLSRNSVAYNALQKVSQRNASAPPLSWTRLRNQNQNSVSFIGSRSKRISIAGDDDPVQPGRNLLAENHDVRSFSFPAKMGDLMESVLTKIIPSRKSSDSLKSPSSEPTLSRILPLEPLRIDEVQTSPILGEIEIFRPTR